MEQNTKIIALVSGAVMLVVLFWIASNAPFFQKDDTADLQQAAPIVITSPEDLPPGIPPPPPPPDFDKNQFHIPGVTDGIATPTPQN